MDAPSHEKPPVARGRAPPAGAGRRGGAHGGLRPQGDPGPPARPASGVLRAAALPGGRCRGPRRARPGRRCWRASPASWCRRTRGRCASTRCPCTATRRVRRSHGGSGVGLLGIDLHSRRRNRLNGTVTSLDDRGFTVGVVQAFGNCPQYIQERDVSFARPPGPAHATTVERATALDAAARATIAAADTFFVASYVDADGDPAQRVGGRLPPGRQARLRPHRWRRAHHPGLRRQPALQHAGQPAGEPPRGPALHRLRDGDLLQLSGTTELVLDGDEVASFQGAQRLWRLRVEQVVRRPGALALRWAFGSFSPRLALTGSWPGSAAGAG